MIALLEALPALIEINRLRNQAEVLVDWISELDNELADHEGGLTYDQTVALEARVAHLEELEREVSVGKPAHLSCVEWLRAQRAELTRLGG